MSLRALQTRSNTGHENLYKSFNFGSPIAVPNNNGDISLDLSNETARNINDQTDMFILQPSSSAADSLRINGLTINSGFPSSATSIGSELSQINDSYPSVRER